jgi:phosphoglycolate phosphatase
MHVLSNSKTIRAVALDFDGTIADSFEVFVAAINTVIKREHPLTPHTIADLRQYPLPEVMQRLGVRRWQLPLLVIRGRREIDKNMETVRPFPGVPQALKALSSTGAKLYIVTSHSEHSVAQFLKEYHLDAYISRVYGSVSLFGKPKALKKLQRQEGITADEIVYVGDEIRDIQAAAKAHMRCAAVGWGFNAAEALASQHPNALVYKPEDLAHVIWSMT